MKKIFTAIVALGMMVSSCGDASGDANEGDGAVGVGSAGEMTVCECVALQTEMAKEVLKGISDENPESREIEKKVSAKYAKEITACKALGDGKSPEELDVMNKQAQECPSMAEMQKIEQEISTKMTSKKMTNPKAKLSKTAPPPPPPIPPVPLSPPK